MKRLLVVSLLLTACAQQVTSNTHAVVPTSPQADVPTTVDTIPVNDTIEEQIVEPAPEPVPKVIAKRRILIIGDSEACSIASSVKKVKLPTDTVYVHCKGATVVQYWGVGGNFKVALQRFPNPDVVLVFLGTNHYWQKVTPPVEPILKIVRDRGFQCVWVGPTAVHKKTWPVNGLIRDAVTPTCDYFDTEAAGIPLWDGVHPDEKGALLWLQKIWPIIPLKYEEQHD